jgi:hypothetical protein
MNRNGVRVLEAGAEEMGMEGLAVAPVAAKKQPLCRVGIRMVR